MSERLASAIDEFFILETRRRRALLDEQQAARHRELFAGLATMIASGAPISDEQRETLRVPCKLELRVHTRHGDGVAACYSIGGGGCAIFMPVMLYVGDPVKLLDGGARVIWVKTGTPNAFGLSFETETPEFRAHVDRMLRDSIRAMLLA